MKHSLIYFGIPTVAISFNMYVIMGQTEHWFNTVFYNYIVIYAILPMTILTSFAIYLARKEDQKLIARLRLESITIKEAMIGLLTGALMLISATLLSPLAVWIAGIGYIPPHWPTELNPAERQPGIPTELMGETLEGNWLVLIFFIFGLVIATLGEELFWRGYVLPRQELYFKERTWIIHGSLWTLFHIFTYWNLIVLLPGALLLSYVVQKTGKTWIGVIAHAFANGIEIIIILALVIA